MSRLIVAEFHLRSLRAELTVMRDGSVRVCQNGHADTRDRLSEHGLDRLELAIEEGCFQPVIGMGPDELLLIERRGQVRMRFEATEGLDPAGFRSVAKAAEQRLHAMVSLMRAVREGRAREWTGDLPRPVPKLDLRDALLHYSFYTERNRNDSLWVTVRRDGRVESRRGDGGAYMGEAVSTGTITEERKRLALALLDRVGPPLGNDGESYLDIYVYDEQGGPSRRLYSWGADCGVALFPVPEKRREDFRRLEQLLWDIRAWA